ncbi:unnamed protein product [Urochloa humidicola]
MARLSEESKELLQAQVELLNQTYSFMKSVALAVALDLRIADAIDHHGGAATLSQILQQIGINLLQKLSSQTPSSQTVLDKPFMMKHHFITNGFC